MRGFYYILLIAMVLYLTVFLLGTAAIISVLAEFKEVIQQSFKKRLRVLTIILIIISLGVEVISEILKSNEVETDRNERIDKEKRILGNIALSYDTIKSIQSKLNQQLKIQNSLSLSAKMLLNKNEKIFRQQKGLSENVDRINNPLLPSNIALFIEVPFDSNKFLSGYFTYITNKILADSTLNPYGSLLIQRDSITHTVRNIFIGDVQYKRLLLNIMENHLKFHVLIFKNNIKLNRTHMSARSGMSFFIGDSTYYQKRRIQFILNLPQKKCFIEVVYEGYNLQSTGSNIFFGVQDLNKSIIVVDHDFALNVMFLNITALKGSQQYCAFPFNKKDVIFNGPKRIYRAQFHRVVLKDFDNLLSFDQIIDFIVK